MKNLKHIKSFNKMNENLLKINEGLLHHNKNLDKLTDIELEQYHDALEQYSDAISNMESAYWVCDKIFSHELPEEFTEVNKYMKYLASLVNISYNDVEEENEKRKIW